MSRIIVIGSSNTDLTVMVDKLPLPGETVLGNDFVIGPGGKGANQAVAAKRLGADVTFVCKVGQDMFGEGAIAQYKKEGLDTSKVLRSSLPSGVALIPVSSDGENSIVVASGANGDLSEADVEAVMSDFDGPGILLLQLEIPVSSVLAAAKIARSKGIKVVLNPAPFRQLPDELFEYIDIFIPNETELASFTSMEVNNEDDVKTAAAALQGRGVGCLIVTLGSKGSMICSGDGTYEIVPAFKVKAVDTTAAGDTFCAGVCVGLYEGKSLPDAVRFATAAAALTVQKVGAQNSLPYRSDLNV